MTESQTAPDLRMGALGDRYESRGELRGTDEVHTYIGKPRDGSAEVAITVVSMPKGAQNNELSHFAADVNILETMQHPSLLRVRDGQWVGKDRFAIITERVQGDSLAELLDRGERFSNPRIALLLQEVSGVLDWAREKGIVHRTVTPDTMLFERDTNRLHVMFTPAPIPITGVPTEVGDARTLGTLAWAMFTGERYDTSAPSRSLGEVAPNLAQRVIDATDKAIAMNAGDEPDIETYLGIIGSGDVLKQAEVEMAAMKEEYDEAHRREIRKLEEQQRQVERHAAEQMAALEGDREKFRHAMADERSAVAAERSQFEQLMLERRERLASVRGELDQQRAEMEKRLADLEAYRHEVEQARDNALAVADRARHDAIADAERWRTEVLEASKAAGATPAAAIRAASAVPTLPKHVAIPTIPIPTAPKALKEMKAPRWDKRMEQLDVSDEELIAGNARMKWILPSGIATVAIIVIAIVYSVMHRPPSSSVVTVGNSKIVATPPTTDSTFVPRAGFLAQPEPAAAKPAAAQTSPLINPPAAAPRIDSAAGAVTPTTRKPLQSLTPVSDSIARARAAAATPGAAPASAAARRRFTQREIDSVNTSPGEWARMQRADSIQRARARRDSLARPDTTGELERVPLLLQLHLN
ncbi:MAG TPA: protein kinase [Casimicrobiaceae bacterium]|jgi:hypothetical protein